jgi:predicted nucleic acid-binding protein
MIILLDSNVIMDLLAKRNPWYKEAVEILKLTNEGKIDSYISGSIVTDIHYLLHDRYKMSISETKKRMDMLLEVFEVAEVSAGDYKQAIDWPIGDYEDNLIDVIAQKNKIDYIVTRDKDFKKAKSKVLSPIEFLKQFS